MGFSQKPTFILTLVALVLCFTLAEASPERRRSSSTSKPTPTPTSCTPTATQTVPATLSFAQWPTGSPGDGTNLVFGNDWGFIACSVYTSCNGECGAACCNKGSCSPSSTTTDLLLGFPMTNPPGEPNFSITPRSPMTAFTIFDITFTTAYFLDQYSSVSVEIKGVPVNPGGNPSPSYTVIIPKPSYGLIYSRVSVNLPSVGLGSVKRLDFIAYFTGSDGSGGQGPGGRVYAEVRLDADGSGAPIHYETYRPLGCTNGYYKRVIGSPVLPSVLVRRTLEGNTFA